MEFNEDDELDKSKLLLPEAKYYMGIKYPNGTIYYPNYFGREGSDFPTNNNQRGSKFIYYILYQKTFGLGDSATGLSLLSGIRQYHSNLFNIIGYHKSIYAYLGLLSQAKLIVQFVSSNTIEYRTGNWNPIGYISEGSNKPHFQLISNNIVKRNLLTPDCYFDLSGYINTNTIRAYVGNFSNSVQGGLTNGIYVHKYTLNDNIRNYLISQNTYEIGTRLLLDQVIESIKNDREYLINKQD